MAGAPLRVVLADDHYLVREGLAALLTTTPDVVVVATVGDADALLSAVAELRPDAVLADIRMPPHLATDGIDAALEIRRRHGSVGVVVLSQHLEEEYVRGLFAEGSAGLGYLLKDRVGERAELVDALHRTARGESVLDRRVVDILVGRPRDRLPAILTDRERDVLAAMAEGLTNPAIAERLHLSVSSVEKHVSAIFGKLGLTEPQFDRRVAAVLAWLDHAHQ
jgi:DNA-binding NarL/FixJ family response regulator